MPVRVGVSTHPLPVLSKMKLFLGILPLEILSIGCCVVEQLGDVYMGKVYITRGTHARGLSVVRFNPAAKAIEFQ